MEDTTWTDMMGELPGELWLYEQIYVNLPAVCRDRRQLSRSRLAARYRRRQRGRWFRIDSDWRRWRLPALREDVDGGIAEEVTMDAFLHDPSDLS